MRNPMIFALASMIIMAALIPVDTSSADRPEYPDEPAVLCYSYYSGGWKHIDTIYVMPDTPIGDLNIPDLVGDVHYWVRMDTGEVVTASSTFAPGTYMISAYTTAPTPWGASPSSSAPDNTLPTVAIVLSVIAIITGVTAIYVVLRRK